LPPSTEPTSADPFKEQNIEPLLLSPNQEEDSGNKISAEDEDQM